MDEKKGLHRIRVAEAWYGGIRHTLRELCDPMTPGGRDIAESIGKRPLYYRYTLSDSHADMQDVLYFLRAESANPTTGDDSGRYRHIYLKEISPDKLVDL